MMLDLQTERLRLRKLTLDDAAFILELINEPSWKQFIGDKGIRTIEGTRDYLINGPMKMYQTYDLGPYAVESVTTGEPMGICGLIKRESLQDVDLGFAFLPRFWGKGYAFESAKAVMEHARHNMRLSRVVAITSVDNESSIKLLERLGFVLETRLVLPGDTSEVNLYADSLAIVLFRCATGMPPMPTELTWPFAPLARTHRQEPHVARETGMSIGGTEGRSHESPRKGRQ
jgi:RimJ/RimL family protein N-acetyltransferase